MEELEQVVKTMVPPFFLSIPMPFEIKSGSNIFNQISEMMLLLTLIDLNSSKSLIIHKLEKTKKITSYHEGGLEM